MLFSYSNLKKAPRPLILIPPHLSSRVLLRELSSGKWKLLLSDCFWISLGFTDGFRGKDNKQKWTKIKVNEVNCTLKQWWMYSFHHKSPYMLSGTWEGERSENTSWGGRLRGQVTTLCSKVRNVRRGSSLSAQGGDCRLASIPSSRWPEGHV